MRFRRARSRRAFHDSLAALTNASEMSILNPPAVQMVALNRPARPVLAVPASLCECRCDLQAANDAGVNGAAKLVRTGQLKVPLGWALEGSSEFGGKCLMAKSR